MASKQSLRTLRSGTVINNTSEKREGKAAAALNEVIVHVVQKFGIKVDHDRSWRLVEIIAVLHEYRLFRIKSKLIDAFT